MSEEEIKPQARKSVMKTASFNLTIGMQDLLHNFCWWRNINKSKFVRAAIQEKLDKEIAIYGQPPEPHSAEIPFRNSR